MVAEQPSPVPEPRPPACKEADRIQSLVSGKEDYAKHLAGPEQQRLKGREELGAIINQQQLDLQPKPLNARDCTQPGHSSHPSRSPPGHLHRQITTVPSVTAPSGLGRGC